MISKELYSCDFEEILELVFSSYIREFGERKLFKVKDKIMASSKINRLIDNSRSRGVPPAPMDFLYCLNEMPYFIFSKGQTQAVAALIALYRWDEEVNTHHFYLSSEELRLRAIDIVEESKATFL